MQTTTNAGTPAAGYRAKSNSATGARSASRPSSQSQSDAGNPVPSAGKEWTVAIYMVADGPSGSRSLDEVAARELRAIFDAAVPENGVQPLERIAVSVQVDLSDQDGIIRWTVGGQQDARSFTKLPEGDAA